jgi:CTP synthase
MLEREKLDEQVLRRLGMNLPSPDDDGWERVVRVLKYPANRVRIAVVGKYIELQDAYKSVYESLTHGGIANDCGVEILRLDSEDLEEQADRLKRLREMDGILVPGGFGSRGIEGKIAAARYAREHAIPYFGLCLGMQIATIEFARNVAKLPDAHSTEFKADCASPVIHLMEEQKTVKGKGGSMRLGAFQCRLEPGSHAAAAYQQNEVSERHRHRFEFNNAFAEPLVEAGLRIAGRNPTRNLVEIVEIPDHPWFVGVQFHPEFQSKPRQAHPLFREFIAAAIRRSEDSR